VRTSGICIAVVRVVQRLQVDDAIQDWLSSRFISHQLEQGGPRPIWILSDSDPGAASHRLPAA
jgi:hypothetical protein